MVIPPGVEPGLLPWKDNVLTSWPRDHIYKAQLRIFLHPKNINLVIKILLYVPLWSLVSLGRFELPVHWLKVSCVTSYATGSDILDGCFAANKHYHRLEEWIFVSCSTRQGTPMLTGRRVVYLCTFFTLLARNGTSCISSNFWFSFLQLLPIRESKPSSLLEPPITNRNVVIFIG